MSLTKYNKGSKFSINTEGFSFVKLSELFNGDPSKVYVIRGVYLFNTKYGLSPCLALDDRMVNLPSHTVNDINNMINDPEAVSQIEAGKGGFKIRTYDDSKHGRGLCYGIEWVDIN